MRAILCVYNWVGCKAIDFFLSKNFDVYVYTHESPYYVNSVINYCKKRGIPYATEKINLKNVPFEKVDIIASIYYRYIIPENVIDLSNGKAFNLHPSILPSYRGCSSLTWAMINGEKNTGFTFHYIDKNIDTGNVILQEIVKIEEYDTQETLYQRVMIESSKYIDKVVDLVLSGYEGEPQKEGGHYYKRGCPNNGEIDENWTNEKVERFIRAMIYPPMPVANFKGSPIFIFKDFIEKINKVE